VCGLWCFNCVEFIVISYVRTYVYIIYKDTSMCVIINYTLVQ